MIVSKLCRRALLWTVIDKTGALNVKRAPLITWKRGPFEWDVVGNEGRDLAASDFKWPILKKIPPLSTVMSFSLGLNLFARVKVNKEINVVPGRNGNGSCSMIPWGIGKFY